MFKERLGEWVIFMGMVSEFFVCLLDERKRDKWILNFFFVFIERFVEIKSNYLGVFLVCLGFMFI